MLEFEIRFFVTISEVVISINIDIFSLNLVSLQ
jgi:hypothetical protein